MPLRTYSDGAGNPIRLMEVDGINYPYVEGVNQEKAVREAKQAKAKPGDVLLIGYAKSGTHWTWEVLSMLANGKAETIQEIKQSHMIEAISPAELASLPSPRILNTHFRFHNLPEDMIRNKTKIVLILRNPKDVAASFYNHHIKIQSLYQYYGSWNDWFPLFLKGHVDVNLWFDYVLDWERAVEEHPDHPIQVMFYEDMKENLYRETKKLARFLEVSLSDSVIRDIAEKCQFENMARDKQGLENDFWKNIWVDKKPMFYRKGQVGDWKNYFTVAQNEQFDKLYEEKMSASKLKLRFEL